MKKDVVKLIKKLNIALKNSMSDYCGVYLYGSYAKDEAKKDSDIDLVAIFENPLNNHKKNSLWDIVCPLEAIENVFFDIHPMTYQELKKNPLYYDRVVNRGIYYGS